MCRLPLTPEHFIMFMFSNNYCLCITTDDHIVQEWGCQWGETNLSIAMEGNTGIALCIIVWGAVGSPWWFWDPDRTALFQWCPVPTCLTPPETQPCRLSKGHHLSTPVSMPVSCRVPPVVSQVPQSFPSQYVWDQPRQQLWPSGDLLHLATTVGRRCRRENNSCMILFRSESTPVYRLEGMQRSTDMAPAVWPYCQSLLSI